MLMPNIQLPGAKAYDSYIEINASPANDLKNTFQTQHGHMDCWITARTEDVPVNVIGLSASIMPKKGNIFLTYQLKCNVKQLSSQNFHFAVRMQNFME